MKKLYIGIVFLAITGASALNAEVTAAVLPFEGDAGAEFRVYVMNQLSSSKQIMVLADDKTAEIVKIHEKAQVTGSSTHDFSKIKSAEYLVTGAADAEAVELTVIDVNTGAKIYYRNEGVTAKNRRSAYYSLSRGAIDKIINEASAKNREVPEEASEYMAILNSLVKSLGSADASSYQYIALYKKGKFVNPDGKDKKANEKISRFLKVLRPNLLRSKLSYLSMEKTSNNVAVIVAAAKAGSVTKHKFVFVELEDGRLAILNETYVLIN